MGNLTTEPTLRQMLSNDIEGIFTFIFNSMLKDLDDKKFDWQDNIKRYLAIMVNCSLETNTQLFLIEKGIIKQLEKVLMLCNYKGDG